MTAQLTLTDAKQPFGTARGHPSEVVGETSTEVRACVVASWPMAVGPYRATTLSDGTDSMSGDVAPASVLARTRETPHAESGQSSSICSRLQACSVGLLR